MIKLFMICISIFSQLNTKKPSNVRLEKVQKSRFEQFCEWIAPYLILSFILILIIFLFCILIRYGHSFSTEANNYYYNMK